MSCDKTTKEVNTLVSNKGLSAVANWDWVLSNRRQEVSRIEKFFEFLNSWNWKALHKLIDYSRHSP